ncbi:MAG TPA: hypothetical protein VGY13_14445 [Solirubrobacteraceae bacterium]|nr:hypothetical protein [Solirubrobacteraceae bacterium]
MNDGPPTPPPPRARALAEVALDALAERAEELARRWAGELVLRRPLERMPELAAGALAREGPALCAQAVRALQSDAELGRLTGAGPASGREDGAPARRLGAICATVDPLALIEAVELLRGVLWEALQWHLPRPADARLVADAGDRLAHVCASLVAGALSAEPAAPAAAARIVEQREPPAGAPAAGRAAESPGERHAPARAGDAAAGRGAVIVDEHEPASAADPAVASREHAPPERRRAPEAPVEPPGEIEIRDQRRDEGPVAWIGSIGAQLERFERDGRPFAVLLVELAELERLRRERPAQELLALSGQLERELVAALGAAVSLTRERAGRCWLVAPGADRPRAEALARRLPGAIPAQAGTRPRQLGLVVSVAVCPDDGRLAATLAAHADIGLYAARAEVRGGAAAAGGERSGSAGERPARGG